MGVSNVEAPEQAPPARIRADWRAHPLVLVGMMGAGKTTIGKRLATRLRLPFVDADAEIERAAKMTVAEIFERFGESHFRDGERRVLARLMAAGPGVIATGGGAFVNPQTRALVLAQGTAIWLDADLETLVRRVARRSHRPLLVGKDPRQVLRAMMELRRPFYAEAPVQVQSSAAAPEHTVEAVWQALRQAAGEDVEAR